MAQPFDHAAHVRVAWAAVCQLGPGPGAELVVDGLRRLTAAGGVPEKFDEALTRAWMARVAAAVAQTPGTVTFGGFAARHPDLFRPSGGSSPRARPTRRTARA